MNVSNGLGEEWQRGTGEERERRREKGGERKKATQREEEEEKENDGKGGTETKDAPFLPPLALNKSLGFATLP
jgi:hypothetical protein